MRLSIHTTTLARRSQLGRRPFLSTASMIWFRSHDATAGEQNFSSLMEDRNRIALGLLRDAMDPESLQSAN